MLANPRITNTVPSKDLETAELLIVRDAENDIKMRGLEIFVDGEYVYDIEFNRSFKTRLPIGSHTIKVSNHLYKKSIVIDLKPGDNIQLQVGNAFGLIGGLMVSVLGMGPYRVFINEPQSVSEFAASQ